MKTKLWCVCICLFMRFKMLKSTKNKKGQVCILLQLTEKVASSFLLIRLSEILKKYEFSFELKF